jgi:hypothetical protein
MSGHPDKIAEHYRELAAEEVALARAAVTNGARANITRWRLSIGASRRPQRMKSSNDHQASRRPGVTTFPKRTHIGTAQIVLQALGRHTS